MEEIRIWRSPLAVYDADPDAWNKPDGEATRCATVYSDEVLQDIAGHGFNGVWLDVHFHDAVFREEFPELGVYAERHQQGIRELIARAARFGIKVYLLMQPPRAINEDRVEFWKNHAGCAGSVDVLSREWCFNNDKEFNNMISLCTSTEPVRKYIRNGFADLSRALPGLGGYIIISASEFSAHCYTRRFKPERQCPRCAELGAAKVIANLLNDIYSGVRSASEDMAVIAWDWSWTHVTDRQSVIDQLDPGLCYMSDTDRGDEKMILGKLRKIDEYCLSLRGVAKNFAASSEYAISRGMRCIPKTQCGTTHELNTVPNLPLVANLYDKAAWFIKNNCGSFLGCWNFGNMQSANTAAFNFFLMHREFSDKMAALKAFAEYYFPGCDADSVVANWLKFSDAMDNFPYDIPDIYTGPQQWALGYFAPPGELTGPCGRGFREEPRGDDLEIVLHKGNFTYEEKLTGYRLTAEGWAAAVPDYVKALKKSSSVHAAEEIATAEVCMAAFRSAWHLIEIYDIKTTCGTDKAFDKYLQICAEELAVTKRVLPFLESDSRQGFNPEPNAYLFDAPRVRSKISELEKVLNK